MTKLINIIKQAQILLKIGQALTDEQKREQEIKKEEENDKKTGTPQKVEKYTIKPGDTLSFIAGDFYGDQSLWPIIAEANNIKTEQELRTLAIGRVLDIPAKRILSPEERAKKLSQARPAFFNPHLDVQKIEEFAKDSQLEDLSTKSFIVLKHTKSKFAHSQLAKALQALSSRMGGPIRVTEAFPPTSQHQSRNHYNGRSVDITIPDPRYADAVCEFLRQQGLKALNEYKYDTKFKTGGHIHIETR